MDVAKHNFNFCLQVRIGKSGTILSISGRDGLVDKFVTRDEAELQALTISRLDAVTIRGWQGREEAIKRDEGDGFMVCVVQMAGWFVSTEFKNGYEWNTHTGEPAPWLIDWLAAAKAREDAKVVVDAAANEEGNRRYKTAKEVITERVAAEQAARPLPSFIKPGLTRENWLTGPEGN